MNEILTKDFAQCKSGVIALLQNVIIEKVT